MWRPNARMFTPGFDVDAVLGDGGFDDVAPFLEEAWLEVLPRARFAPPLDNRLLFGRVEGGVVGEPFRADVVLDEFVHVVIAGAVPGRINNAVSDGIRLIPFFDQLDVEFVETLRLRPLEMDPRLVTVRRHGMNRHPVVDFDPDNKDGYQTRKRSDGDDGGS